MTRLQALLDQLIDASCQYQHILQFSGIKASQQAAEKVQALKDEIMSAYDNGENATLEQYFEGE